jgi:mannose-6-phosphate isomerase-like protein (cupin superfamily)
MLRFALLAEGEWKMSDLMNGREEAIVSGYGAGRPVHVLGADLTIKISSRDTNGAFAVFEGRTAPLEGPPLHRHSQHDEYWYIVEGEYRFEIDGAEVYASAGASVYAPRGSRHTFQNIGTERGWTITTVVPGGIDLFFEELDRAVPRGAIPDPAKIQPIFDKYGQELLGPPLRARSARAGS